jgi:hypothetical protein
MRAAEAALPFERPKLAAVLSASMDDLGDKLERARLRAIEGASRSGGPRPEPRALPRPGSPPIVPNKGLDLDQLTPEQRRELLG